jgi:prolyl 4-hydroxylase
MASSGTIDRVDALLAARRFAEATRLLLAAADAGETAAIAELVRWRIVGNIIHRDLAEARRLLAVAAAGGHSESGLLHAGFLAGGVGGPDDWPAALAELRTLAGREERAAAQLRLIEAMDLGADGFPSGPIELRLLGEAPYVAAAEGLVSKPECDYLKAAAEPGLTPSVVVDPATRQWVPNPVRRSAGTVFSVFAEDLVVNALNRRIASLSGTRLDQAEPLQPSPTSGS